MAVYNPGIRKKAVSIIFNNEDRVAVVDMIAEKYMLSPHGMSDVRELHQAFDNVVETVENDHELIPCDDPDCCGSPSGAV